MSTSLQAFDYDQNKRSKKKEQNKPAGLSPLRIATIVCALVAACMLASPSRCLAYNIITPFGALYGPENHQHLGADVAQDASSPIVAPVSGTVTFCGKIPKADGQRVVALTIKTADERLVTVSPLQDSGIARGQIVAKGQSLGALASAGDPSARVPHLHVSLRIKKKYVDPSALIAPSLEAAAQGAASTQGSEIRAQVGAQVKPRIDVRAQSLQGEAHTSERVTQTQHQLQKQAEYQAQEQKHSAHEGQSAKQRSHVLSSHAPATARASSALTSLKERSLSISNPLPASAQAHNVQNVSAAQSALEAPHARVEIYSAKRFSSLSQADVAGIIFLSGLTLTLAGLGGYTLLDRKFDGGRKFAQLAVRGQR